jgi:heme/copper-type cytochrome/quinol oxidase subunit 2
MTGWLIFIAVLLVLIVLFQVTKTLDLVNQLRGDDDSQLEKTSKLQAYALLVFMILGVIGFFWCFKFYRPTNIEVASVHGVLIENMFIATLIVTGIVLVLCNVLLFLFAFQYRYKKNRVATHFAHSNKLEFIWTVIPTIVLTGLVVFGLQSWTSIMGPPSEEAIVFEMTGQQFFWSSRYPGKDGKLGPRDYNLICPENPLGIVTEEYVEHRLNILRGNADLNVAGEIPTLQQRKKELPGLIAELQTKMDKRQNEYMRDQLKEELDALETEFEEIDDKILRREQTIERIENKFTKDYYMANSEAMTWGYDDILPSEIHLPVNKEAVAKIIALDVLHNFYVPHMKVKMDAVPGMPTSFKFTPTVTTVEMRNVLSKNPTWQRVKEGDTDPVWKRFNYEVACAELCGVGHSAMKYTMVIETEAEYQAWLDAQIPYWNAVAAGLKIAGFSKSAPVITKPEEAAPADTLVAPQDTTAAIAIK